MTNPCDSSPAAEAAPVATELHREVLRPSTDRGRLAALATVCSLAGVALGFAMAGTMFASLPLTTSEMRVVHHPCAAVAPSTPSWVGVGVRGGGPTPGAWIRLVRPGSPAAEHGLMAGDVITRVDDQVISDADDLVYQIRSRRPGTRIELGVRRGQSIRSEQLTLEPMPFDVWRQERVR